MFFYIVFGVIVGLSLGLLMARVSNIRLAKDGYVMIKVPPGMEATIQPILSGRLHTPEELQCEGAN